MENLRGSQQRRQGRREDKRVETSPMAANTPSIAWKRSVWRLDDESDLQAAIKDLRNALSDELGGNDEVRDCAFEVVAAYDQAVAARATRCEVTIQAQAHFSCALVEGITAAGEQGIDYSNRERRLIGEVLAAYGRATAAGGAVRKPFFGRCELTHSFTEVCRFTFQPKQADPS